MPGHLCRRHIYYVLYRAGGRPGHYFETFKADPASLDQIQNWGRKMNLLKRESRDIE